MAASASTSRMVRALGLAMAVATAVLVNPRIGGAGDDKKGMLQGTWYPKAEVVDGKEKELTPPKGKEFTSLTFGPGGKYTTSFASIGYVWSQGTYKADDTKKPRHLDVTLKEVNKGKASAWIYEVTGDVLKIAYFADPEKWQTRPPSFDSPGLRVTLYRRIR